MNDWCAADIFLGPCVFAACMSTSAIRMGCVLLLLSAAQVVGMMHSVQLDKQYFAPAELDHLATF